MPILHDFDYHRPSNLKDAINLLGKYRNAAVLAGGTDLVPEMKENVSAPDAVIDIKQIPRLNKIEQTERKLHIGALVTFSDILDSKLISKKLPVLIEICRNVASPGIRNRATLVGNICSAVPCMDSGPILTALDAIVVTSGPVGKRKIPISEWFRGNRKTSIKKSEIVTGVIIPLPPSRHGGCYIKLGRYNGEDLAQASVLVAAFPNSSFRISFGSVGPAPIRAGRIEKILARGEPLDTLIAEARAIIPEIISPITDIRASKEYRLHMAGVMFERAVRTARSRLLGNGPEYGQCLI